MEQTCQLCGSLIEQRLPYAPLLCNDCLKKRNVLDDDIPEPFGIGCLWLGILIAIVTLILYGVATYVVSQV